MNKVNKISVFTIISFFLLSLTLLFVSYRFLSSEVCYSFISCGLSYIYSSSDWVAYAILGFGVYKKNYKLLMFSLTVFLLPLFIQIFYFDYSIVGILRSNSLFSCIVIASIFSCIAFLIFSMKSHRLKRNIASIIAFLPAFVFIIFFLYIMYYYIVYLNFSLVNLIVILYYLLYIVSYALLGFWLIDNKYSTKKDNKQVK